MKRDRIIAAVFFGTLFVILIFWALSCTTITPPGTTATRTTVVEEVPQTEPGLPAKVRTTETTEVESHGAGLEAFLRAPPREFSPGEAGKVDLGEGTVGRSRAKAAEWAASVRSAGPWASIIGALAVLAGLVIAFALGEKKFGLCLAGGGAVLLFLCHIFAAYGGWILIGALIIGGGLLAWRMGAFIHLKTAFDRVVSGVERAERIPKPGGVKEKVLEAAGSDEATVRKAVKKAKARLGISPQDKT